MNQADLLRYVVDVLEAQRLPYMIVGSFASASYGEPRLTHDIDLVVQLRGDAVERLCNAFPAPGRLDRQETRPLARQELRGPARPR